MASLKQRVDERINQAIGSLPERQRLSKQQQRDIIARYTAVLEGNFIYWMTAAHLAAKSPDARAIIADNLLDEVRDSHPVMLRRFAIAAAAFPKETDSLAVDDALTKVRLFMGTLSGVQILLAMAFLEGFIQAFMPYLANLASVQGSSEFQYTDVHGFCDIAHTEGLLTAVVLEMADESTALDPSLFQGINLLESLLNRIVYGNSRYDAA